MAVSCAVSVDIFTMSSAHKPLLSCFTFFEADSHAGRNLLVPMTCTMTQVVALQCTDTAAHCFSSHQPASELEKLVAPLPARLSSSKRTRCSQGIFPQRCNSLLRRHFQGLYHKQTATRRKTHLFRFLQQGGAFVLICGSILHACLKATNSCLTLAE